LIGREFMINNSKRARWFRNTKSKSKLISRDSNRQGAESCNWPAKTKRI